MSDETNLREAPKTFSGILKELGPGLIITGSIVGSGELIATTLTGAEAEFWLMWLILIGCVIKVFAQLEIGRYTITTGHTSLEGLSRLPGIKPLGVHWTVWLWLIMFVASLGQAGAQNIPFPKKTVSFVKIQNLEHPGEVGWSAMAEVQVFGRESPEK